MEATSAGGGTNRLAVAGSCPAATGNPCQHQSRITVQRSQRCLTSTFSPFCSLTTCRCVVPRSSRWEPFLDDYSDDEADNGVSEQRRSRKRRWWSDYKPFSLEPEDEGIADVLEKALSSFWIFKVFKSFGWTLPPILLSWLLAGGPKAFLMAFTLSLGLSILAFTYDKLVEPFKTSESIVRKKSMKRSGVNRGGDPLPKIDIQGEQKNRKRTNLAGDASRILNQTADQSTSTLGGWDTLDRMEFEQPKPEFEYYSGANSSTKVVIRNVKESLPVILNLAAFRSMEL